MAMTQTFNLFCLKHKKTLNLRQSHKKFDWKSRTFLEHVLFKYYIERLRGFVFQPHSFTTCAVVVRIVGFYHILGCLFKIQSLQIKTEWLNRLRFFLVLFFSDNSQTNSKCFVQSVTELKLRQMFFIETDAKIETKEGARDLIY